MVFDRAGLILVDSFYSGKYCLDLGDNGGFLRKLAQDSSHNPLAELHFAAGKTPSIHVRFFRASDHEHLPVLEKNGDDTDDRFSALHDD